MRQRLLASFSASVLQDLADRVRRVGQGGRCQPSDSALANRAPPFYTRLGYPGRTHVPRFVELLSVAADRHRLHQPDDPSAKTVLFPERPHDKLDFAYGRQRNEPRSYARYLLCGPALLRAVRGDNGPRRLIMSGCAPFPHAVPPQSGVRWAIGCVRQPDSPVVTVHQGTRMEPRRRRRATGEAVTALSSASPCQVPRGVTEAARLGP
jgi:hypothetical protein